MKKTNEGICMSLQKLNSNVKNLLAYAKDLRQVQPKQIRPEKSLHHRRGNRREDPLIASSNECWPNLLCRLCVLLYAVRVAQGACTRCRLPIGCLSQRFCWGRQANGQPTHCVLLENAAREEGPYLAEMLMQMLRYADQFHEPVSSSVWCLTVHT